MRFKQIKTVFWEYLERVNPHLFPFNFAIYDDDDDTN